MNSATSGSRKHCKASTDMIMDLPLNLIQQILERLPLQDAARMSVLSKDWRYIWLSLPHIKLDLKFSQAIQKQNVILDFQYRYSDTVSKILLRHRGDIHKFVLDVPSQLPKSTDIDCWIEFVCQHGIKDLHVNDHRLTKLKPPSCLFSCESLTKLTLHCGSFSLPSTYGGFPCLVRLFLYTSEDNNVKLETLIRSCPQLKTLGLVLSKAIHSLTIHSSKLNHLAVTGVNNTVNLEEPERIRMVGLSIQGGDMVDLLRRMPSLELLRLSNFRIGVYEFMTCALNTRKCCAAVNLRTENRVFYRCLCLGGRIEVVYDRSHVCPKAYMKPVQLITLKLIVTIIA